MEIVHAVSAEFVHHELSTQCVDNYSYSNIKIIQSTLKDLNS